MNILNLTSPITSANQLCQKILYTSYISTKYSSCCSRERSLNLASDINSHHCFFDLDDTINSTLSTLKPIIGRLPSFSNELPSDHLALQNLQARLRMVVSYLISQTIVPAKSTFLLMLGTGNADEGITGYFTKYDCSSADINPLGGMSKNTVRSIVQELGSKYNLTSTEKILKATPSAELRPTTVTEQSDEVDLGLSYNDIERMSQLRLDEKMGFDSISEIMGEEATLKFSERYRLNRHKIVVATPSFICQSSATDDCRTDFRPIFYPKKSNI